MTALTNPMRLAPPPRSRPTAPANLVLAAIYAGALLVVALWWRDTSTVAGLGDWLTNAGRITGLLGGYAVVVQLLLMARVPAFEHGIGADRLARWHSFGGRYTVSLLSAHVVLILWGYAITAHTSVTTQAQSFLTGYRDIVLATIGMGLLLAVAATSARAARRRLSYETWLAIHFATYAAVALAFLHQVRMGADFVGNRPMQLLWGAMYVGVGGLLAWYRVVVPVRMSLRHRLRVADVTREAPGVVSLVLTGHHLPALGAEAGQFLRLRFLTRDGWWQSHPFSLSAPPHPTAVRITVKDLGDHTRQLQGIARGTRVLVAGPYGAFTEQRRTRHKVLLVAGGVGITPVRALFETLAARPGDVTLVYRVSHPDDFIFRPELDAIAARHGARVEYLAGHRRGPADPFVGGRLRRLVPDVDQRDVFVCGPGGFTESVITAVRAAGVPARHIFAEEFAF